MFNFTSYHFLCSYVKQSGRRFFRVHTFTWKDKKKKYTMICHTDCSTSNHRWAIPFVSNEWKRLCHILLFSKAIRRVLWSVEWPIHCVKIEYQPQIEINVLYWYMKHQWMLTKKCIINSDIFLIDYLYFEFLKRASFNLFVKSFLTGADVNMGKCVLCVTWSI